MQVRSGGKRNLDVYRSDMLRGIFLSFVERERERERIR